MQLNRKLSINSEIRESMRQYYKELALPLYDNGYRPIPTIPKSKLPLMHKGESWQTEVNREVVARWVANGKGAGGVALTGLCAIDFDIYDREVSNLLFSFCRQNFDNLIVRIGMKPKFLFVLSSKSAIHKKKKNTWYDKSKQKHEIELLAAGDQYFMGYGIHPDTGQEFTWLNGKDLLTIKSEALPVFDSLDIASIEDEFDKIAESRGWSRIKPSKLKEYENKLINKDAGDFTDYKQPGCESPEKIKALLGALPQEYCDDRDEWIRIGSAVHHATGGSEDGFKLFNAWSQKSEKYKDSKDTRARWASFSVEKSGSDCATIGTIVHILQSEGLYDNVKEIVTTSSQSTSTNTFTTRIESAKDKNTLRQIMTDIQKNTMMDRLTRSDLAAAIRDRVRCKEIKGSWKLSDITSKITPLKVGAGMEDRPSWLDGYIYITNQDMFGIVRTDQKYTRSALCGMYNRFLVDRDDLEPKCLNADRYALETVQIEYAHEGLYFPGQPDRFNFNGNDVYNTYDPSSEGERLPREKWEDTDHEAVKALEDHIRATFNREGEADVLLDVMAHIVQNPVDRLGWMLILCGCEGDGKTMIGEVLARAVGETNAHIVNAHDVINNTFTDWVVGHRLKFIEELRASGRNRYEVTDNLKPFVTNKQVSVHPKYMKPYTTPNTASFIATTNHPDAIPYQDDSRRYTVITSKWIRQSDIFAEYGPDYFHKMFNLLENHTPAVNEWLATREISQGFNSHKHPVTPSLLAGIEAEKTDLRRVIEEIIESGASKNINKHVIVMADLRRRIQTMIDLEQVDIDIVPTFAEIKRAVLKLKYRITTKQHTIDGKGIYPYIKGIEESRNSIRDAIGNSKYDEDLPF